MQQGAIPERDPRMLARAILGLYNSIWHWYRPDQTLLLATIAEFFTARMLAVAGVPPDGTPRRPESSRPMRSALEQSRRLTLPQLTGRACRSRPTVSR